MEALACPWPIRRATIRYGLNCRSVPADQGGPNAMHLLAGARGRLARRAANVLDRGAELESRRQHPARARPRSARGRDSTPPEAGQRSRRGRGVKLRLEAHTAE